MDFYDLMDCVDLLDLIGLMALDPSTIPREELLKQQCHTGKVVSNIHRLGPRNTQKMQMN